MNVTIYQINWARDKDRVAFMSFDGAQKYQAVKGVNSAIYDQVYKGSFEAKDLEEIYRIFNMQHPKDFRGHSLSVSDVVEISDGQKSSFYFCDSVGFKPIAFDPGKTQVSPLANFKVERKPENIHLEARLGIGLDVTPQEFEILKRGDDEAHKLLAQLVQSNRCTMGGDTYFPQPWNEELLNGDLNFDLPSVPIHPDSGKKPSLDQQIQNCQSRTASLPANEKSRGTELEH